MADCEPAPPRAGFSWKDCLLCALPLMLTLAAFWLAFGSEAAVEAHFRAVRAANPLYRKIVEFVTDGGNYLVNLPFVYIFLRGLRRRDRADIGFAVAYALALAATVLLTELIKEGVGRARPFVDQYGYVPWVTGDDYDSFPSGHTTQSMAAMLTLAVRLRRPRLSSALGALGAVVPLTRILLGVHFLGDLLGGTVMGALCAFLASRLADRFAVSPERAPPSPPPPRPRR